MKLQYTLVLGALFWSSLIGFAAHAEPRDVKGTPDTNIIPFLTFVPDHSRVGGLSDTLNNSASNIVGSFPYTIPPSAMSPDRRRTIEDAADADRDPNSALDKKEESFPPMLLLLTVGPAGVAVLVWWRKRKSERLKRSMRRLLREIEHEWVRYDSYEEVR